MSTWGWNADARLGRGGFGEVYEAYGPTSARLAAKVVPKTVGATREQLIAQDAPDSPHVVPVLHVEETSDSFVLYMPRADLSLRDKINTGVSGAEAVTILADLASALNTIAPVVVHRDIKPENFLYLNGTWALCDFGIARYADAATASDTRKRSFTFEYAAPEQWRHERATAATDVYAFGVIAYEILAGRRPFDGDEAALREAHLNGVPDLLPGNKKLAWTIAECLFKPPGARPAAGNLIGRLQRAGAEAATQGGMALAAAQSAVLQARSMEQAAAEAARSERERREALAQSCVAGYTAIAEELIEYITDNAPATEVSRSAGRGITLELGLARLRIAPVATFPGTERSDFDVIAYGEIRLQSKDGSRSRSHSLYFANFDDEAHYGWAELGFTGGYAGRVDFENDPRALPPADGLIALGDGFGTLQVAYGVIPLDIGDLTSFADRWADRFGRAASGQFPQVFQLPDGRTSVPARRSR